MARRCPVTGKRPMVGHHVSHANNKTRRLYLPNLHVRHIWIESQNRAIRVRLSNAALRLIDTKGADAVLASLRARGPRNLRSHAGQKADAKKSSWNPAPAVVISIPRQKTSASSRIN